MNNSRKVGESIRLDRRFMLLLTIIVLGAISIPALIAEARMADPSRDYYQSGRRLFEAKRFGEALSSFQNAIVQRRNRYSAAAARLDTIIATLSSAQAKLSISALLDYFQRQDFIDSDIEKTKAKANGYLMAELALFRMEKISTDFGDFIDILLLVLDKKPLAELDDSLTLLRRSCLDLSSYPEAEYWIGKIYEVEGETRLAELQFQRAYGQRIALEIPDERFDILVSLSSLYRGQKNWKAYETIQSEILSEDPLFRDEKRFLREAMDRTLASSGFDLFMALYRVEEGPWTEAELGLGEFYLVNGRAQASLYLAAAANGVISKCLGRIAEKDPSFSYTTIGDFLDKAQEDRNIREYILSSGLAKTLYELGLALDAGGSREPARLIWSALAARTYLEPWDKSAKKALRDRVGI